MSRRQLMSSASAPAAPPVAWTVAGSPREPIPASKRALDVFGAGFGLVVLSPLFVLTAAIIKLESRGPAFFKQLRVGRNGTPFTMYKFRTMADGCDPAVHREHVRRLITGEAGDESRNAEGSFKLGADPRITKFGHLLRASSMDEMPQLVNVLRGEMSLVGPRPPLPYEVEQYEPRHMRRLEATPGMTGLWQVSGRTRLTFEEMVDLDVSYADSWSFWLDLRILLRTIPAVIDRKGAG